MGPNPNPGFRILNPLKPAFAKPPKIPGFESGIWYPRRSLLTKPLPVQANPPGEPTQSQNGWMAPTRQSTNEREYVSLRISLYRHGSRRKQYHFPPNMAGIQSLRTAQTPHEMLANSITGEDYLPCSPLRLAGKPARRKSLPPYGWYSDKETNTSFIGWGPVDDPQFMSTL